MHKIHIPFSAKSFLAYEYFQTSIDNRNLLLTFTDEESAVKAFKQLEFFFGKEAGHKLLYFPSLDTLPYDRVSPNHKISAMRADALTTLATKEPTEPKLIVTCAANLIIKVPPKSIFQNSRIILKPGTKISIEELIFFLVTNGFTRNSSAIESGEFALRGEIIDIIKSEDTGYRINFGWEKIESIRQFDVTSQISTKTLDKIELSAASESVISPDNIDLFRTNFLKAFGVNHIRSNVYESVISGRKFQGYEHLMPLFYEETSALHDYLGDCVIIYDNLALQSIAEMEKSYHDFYDARMASNRVNPDNFYYALPVNHHILGSNAISELLSANSNIFIGGNREENTTLAIAKNYESIKALPKNQTQAPEHEKNQTSTRLQQLFTLIKNHKDKIVICCTTARSTAQRVKTIMEINDYHSFEINALQEAKKGVINLAIAYLSESFTTDKYLFIAQQEILGDKFTSATHKSSKRKLKNLLTELDNINEGELIVHKDHGIGRFELIETIIVENIAHDCLKISYANNDILYLPVENIDLISKYGDSLDTLALDKLGGVAWQKRKAKLKNLIKETASALVKNAAERLLYKTKPVYYDPETYAAFCNRFPYTETEDQLNAISDIDEDLKSGHLMDRLICGDVGFGKTEVAMRAAFMVACDLEESSPQVAVISPTTILCRQHYQNFIERFAGIDVKIKQASRLVTNGEMRQIKADVANGDVSIIIGTHALLAKDLKFKNLKLLIIDEEQHFGVTQKEYLKSLKSGVHVLSLSATPIPRTLQMSMSGLKDLSLIATPPIDRLPVRTNVLPFDGVVIRDALLRERFRGGKSFFVVPRIKDIEWVVQKLSEYTPELSFRIAHGQMTPAEIDNVMNEFCDGAFDILVSTTIIESGIDIPSANTIIIHRADMLGLSQLYQLRGRVGRGKVRGYAYLTLENKKLTTKHSWQRLEILQNIDSLGAGFTIATHDMDMRGFGNLVGDQQSGHIKEVGAELYQEMLDEAVAELQNTNSSQNTDFTPSINLAIPVYIPANYIADSSLRLAIYRRAANLKNHTEIEAFIDEMVDRFGSIPNEFQNLLKIVHIKHKCQELKIESLDSGPNGFVIKFSKNYDVSERVMAFVAKHPRHTKIKPDNKLIVIKNLAQTEDLLKEAEKLLDSI